MSRQLGFTLIELIITLIILSLIILSGTYAYQYMTENWERNKSAYESELKNYQVWTLVYEAIQNTGPKMVLGDETHGFYFLGRQNGFTGYTKTSVQAPEYPAVYRLFIEASETQAQSFSLVYEEAVLDSFILKDTNQELPFDYRVVLFDAADNISLSYWGWESYRARLNNDVDFSDIASSRQWFNEYDGMLRNEHPQKILVSVDGLEWTIHIADITSELSQQVLPDDI